MSAAVSEGYFKEGRRGREKVVGWFVWLRVGPTLTYFYLFLNNNNNK